MNRADQRAKSGSAGAREAARAFKLPKGKPSDLDRPPVRPFPGKKPKMIDGQLDLDGSLYRSPSRRGRAG